MMTALSKTLLSNRLANCLPCARLTLISPTDRSEDCHKAVMLLLYPPIDYICGYGLWHAWPWCLAAAMEGKQGQAPALNHAATAAVVHVSTTGWTRVVKWANRYISSFRS